MTRKFLPSELVIASHNAGKVREISTLLSPYVERFVGASELGLPEPEETADTFEGNAALKALAAARGSGMVALADDSGLCVNGLGGDPGIYSARWALCSAKASQNEAPKKDFDVAMRRVHEALGDAVDRSAYFVCVLALAWPDGTLEHFRGEVHGDLIWPVRGTQGFGYDPMFVPSGEVLSFAEMDPVAKHAMSNRAKAFEAMVKAVF